MPLPQLRLDIDSPELRAGLARIRQELEVPGPHSPAAVAEAEEAARRVLGGLDAGVGARRRDARDLELITIDPPGSRDLDQALHIESRGTGWRVHYAIADVAAFVRPGGALADEVQQRGVTFYLPDHRTPLHPPVLGEDAASLLPGADRAALLWTVDLDGEGEVLATELERAVVRSRAQLTYEEVQVDVDGGRATGTIALLPEVGEARQRLEAQRDGVSLDLPTQQVTQREGEVRLEHDRVVPAMGWNAQISLLTGMVAADAMQRAGVGLLRTLPPPDPGVIAVVRRTATALGIPWPAGASYQTVIRGLDGSHPDHAALLVLASRGLRGAGYLPLLPGEPAPTDRALVEHAAVAAPYAHVTAPLRRLCDRATNEVCVALFAGRTVPDEAVAELPALPAAMASARNREGAAARAAIDLVEALVLAPRVGEELDATVVATNGDRSTVILDGLAVHAAVAAPSLPLGDPIRVRLERTDPVARQIELSVVR